MKEKTRGLFITGIDTGIGKTLVTCALARVSGRQVRLGIMKPFASGDRSDARKLQKASGRKDLSLEEINPFFFKEPLSPYSASRREGRKVDLNKILKSYRSIERRSDFMLVEGIGGLHTPLTQGRSVADLIRALNLPLIIVTHPWLGTLNHTLLTVDFALRKGIKLVGLIVNEGRRKRKDPSCQTNTSDLPHLTGQPLLGFIPFIRGRFEEKAEEIVRQNLISVRSLLS